MSLLVVIDLHAHGVPSRVLRGMLRSRVFEVSSIAGVPWLVLAPPGDGGDRSWCRGSAVLEPAQLLDSPALEALTAEVIRISDALEAVFQSPDPGLSAGAINRDFIRMWTHELVYREHAIMAACRCSGASRVLILSSHANRSRWLAAGLVERGIPARGRGLPDWRWQRRQHRAGAPCWPSDDLPRADLLLVAESVPMAQSFAAVAAVLPHTVRAETLGLSYLPPAATIPWDSIRQINLAGLAPRATRRRPGAGAPIIAAPHADAGHRLPPGIPGSIRGSFKALRSRLIVQGLPGQEAWARHVLEVLRSVRPRLVVVGNDRCWTGQTYTLLARAEGIDTVVVQDGIAAQNDPTWQYSTADHVLAAGSLWPRLLGMESRSPRSVSVVGQPRYDGVSRRFLARRTDSARVSSPQVSRALFVLQDIHAPDYVETVLREILRLEGIEVMVRAHPAFRPAGLDRLSGPRVQFSRGGNIVDDLAWADVVVTEYSTVAVEALALGLPVLSVTLSGRPPLLDFTVPGQAEKVADRSQIGPALHRLLGANDRSDPSPARQAILDDLIGPLDDRSALRVAGIVDHILEAGAA